MKYIRTKDGRIVKVEEHMMIKETTIDGVQKCFRLVYKDRPFTCVLRGDKDYIVKQANTIEELCDCFVKIKRKGNCKPYILKFDYRDLPTLKEQAIKYKDSPVYGAIHIEDKGLIYVAKMNEKGELELL